MAGGGRGGGHQLGQAGTIMKPQTNSVFYLLWPLFLLKKKSILQKRGKYKYIGDFLFCGAGDFFFSVLCGQLVVLASGNALERIWNNGMGGGHLAGHEPAQPATYPRKPFICTANGFSLLLVSLLFAVRELGISKRMSLFKVSMQERAFNYRAWVEAWFVMGG